jgi:hypothetical protein
LKYCSLVPQGNLISLRFSYVLSGQKKVFTVNPFDYKLIAENGLSVIPLVATEENPLSFFEEEIKKFNKKI